MRVSGGGGTSRALLDAGRLAAGPMLVMSVSPEKKRPGLRRGGETASSARESKTAVFGCAVAMVAPGGCAQSTARRSSSALRGACPGGRIDLLDFLAIVVILTAEVNWAGNQPHGQRIRARFRTLAVSRQVWLLMPRSLIFAARNIPELAPPAQMKFEAHVRVKSECPVLQQVTPVGRPPMHSALPRMRPRSSDPSGPSSLSSASPCSPSW